MAERLPPWLYPRDELPKRWTLRHWRRIAARRARAAGAKRACGICKRPLHAWGFISLKHPRSYGKTRRRDLCTNCAELLIHMLDVLEWFGACDGLAPEDWEGFEPRPEDVGEGGQWAKGSSEQSAESDPEESDPA